MTKYRVYARETRYLYVTIDAPNKDMALEAAESMYADDFHVTEGFSEKEIDRIEGVDIKTPVDIIYDGNEFIFA